MRHSNKKRKNNITEISISFSGSVELANPLDSKSLLEWFPDLGSQPIPKHHFDFVLSVLGLCGNSQEVSAHFSDVLRYLKIKMMHLSLRLVLNYLRHLFALCSKSFSKETTSILRFLNSLEIN